MLKKYSFLYSIHILYLNFLFFIEILFNLLYYNIKDIKTDSHNKTFRKYQASGYCTKNYGLCGSYIEN